MSRLVSGLLLAACNRPTPEPVETTSCATCHAAIENEWSSSFHRVSFTDGTYQETLALEEPKRHAFCNGCHAPARDRTAGADCVSCHGASPHEKEKKTAAVDTCKNCHEFSFEGRAELVQKTLSEHAASDFANVACTACHMPPRDGRATSTRPGRPTSRMRCASRSVSIRVDAVHAFPTGDMFRGARRRVRGACGRRDVGDAERIFGRTWAGRVDGARTEASDTRIRGAWSEEISLDPSGPIARVRWSIVYERIVAMRPPHINLASTDVLASGDLAWN